MVISKRGGWTDISLTGNFDGSDACELVNIIESLSKKRKRFKINALGLNKIEPFGLTIWWDKKNRLPKEITIANPDKRLKEY